MTRKERFLQAQKAVERSLRGVDRGISQFAAQWNKVQLEQERSLLKALYSDKLGDLRHRRRVALKVKNSLRNLLVVTRKPMENLVTDAFESGRGASSGVLDLPLQKISVFDESALAILNSNLLSGFERVVNQVGRRTDDIFRRAALEHSVASLSGEGFQKGSRGFEKRLSEEGMIVFIDASSRKWELSHYAEMALRTTTSEAIAKGTEGIMRRHGFDLIDVSVSQDPCVVCKPYDGNTYSLFGKSVEYPKLDVVFPIHPQCEHFFLPSLKAKQERDFLTGALAA